MINEVEEHCSSVVSFTVLLFMEEEKSLLDGDGLVILRWKRLFGTYSLLSRELLELRETAPHAASVPSSLIALVKNNLLFVLDWEFDSRYP